MRKKSVLIRFLRYFALYKGSIILAMGCTLVASICELVPIQILADTLDALKLLEGYNQRIRPISISFFEINDYFEGFKITLTDAGDALRFFLWILGGFLSIVFIKGLFDYSNDFLMERVGNKLSLRVRNDLYEKIISAPIGVISQHHTGDVMTRVTDDVRMLQRAVAATASIMRAVIKVTILMSMMFFKNVELTIYSILILPIIAYFISRIGTRVREASEEIQQRSTDIYTQLKETLSGINIIKSFTAERIEIDRFQSVTGSQYSSAIRRARFAALLPPVIEWMSAIAIAVVIGLGCWQVIDDKLSIGWFAGYFVMAGLMFKPIKTIGRVNNVLQESLASAERVFYLLDFKREQVNVSDGKTKLSNVQGAVEFQNVSFAYQQRPIIKNVSFKAERGQVIALVGPSGSGKTTLLSLLQRFYSVDSGTISIDNIPIDEITLKSLRQNIALVPQDTFLFDGTVLENIEYGSPGSTKERIVDAAKKANAHSFIMKMPKDYETPIGEAGGNLSGGEQQRISIARAILKDAPLLVLDEATSALDTQSETIIQESLTNLMEGRTSFIIAHRLSTVMCADKILVISDGEIAESGNHTTLLEKEGLYKKLCEQQLFG